MNSDGSPPRVWPGRPYPLGATWDGEGTNFSVFSESASSVDVCLFDSEGNETAVALPECIGYVWHGYLPDVGPGQRYGFRAHGPTGPGDLHSPFKLLIDPYARAIEGSVQWEEAQWADTQRSDTKWGDAQWDIAEADSGDPENPASELEGPPHDRHSAGGAHPLDAHSALDSAPAVPRSVVVNPWFDWGDDRRPATPWNQTVLYEVHVKGFTQEHPGVPPEHRGTYLGLCSQPVIEHLQRLGVTAVELMPVHQFVHDQRLVAAGLRNFWGYNSIGFFAPHDEYSVGGGDGAQVQEFKVMVKRLHSAGIEVILDVVYNHTAEAGAGGPVLSFKGLDNRAYYRLDPQDPSRYVDYTGTGNTLNMRHPHVLQLIMDSLRYWVEEMHVDGFRFDLAATLARELHDVDRLSAFFDLIQQDPVVSQVKLIAEPWDVGEGGYQVGNFPPLWSEWNGRYRDCVRDVWRGHVGSLGELGERLTGSSDLYEDDGRRPHASINFVTAHDGFTLADLVSYEHKRNAANGEDNRDGTDDNRSWNCGVEGPTTDVDVLLMRARQRRNFLTTLMVSQGVPMVVAGDEFGRTQHGNNNGYAQDNEVSWVDWESVDGDLLEFSERLIALRRSVPALRRRRFLTGVVGEGASQPDVSWFGPSGDTMDEYAWSHQRALAMWLNGALEEVGPRGETIVGPTVLVLINPHYEAIDWRIPSQEWGTEWDLALTTAAATGDGDGLKVAAGDHVHLMSRSIMVLTRPT